jgi:hypothetical protein
MKVTFSSETRCNKSRKRGLPGDVQNYDIEIPIAGAKAKASAFVRRLGGQKRGLPSKKGGISLEYVQLAADSPFLPNTKRHFSDGRHPMRIPAIYPEKFPATHGVLNRSRQCSTIKKSDVYPFQNFYKRVELRVNLGSYPRPSSILFALVHVLLGKPRFCLPNRRANVDFCFFRYVVIVQRPG